MQLYTIPIEGRFILYRPLRKLAFVGNRAMAEQTHAVLQRIDSAPGGAESDLSSCTSEEVLAFLQAAGFLEPDAPPPGPPRAEYLPTTAVLLMTNRCNLRCTYCYASGGEGPVQDLTMELARPVIDLVCQNAHTLGKPQFDLSFHGGGEPLQAWDTMQEAVAYAQSKDLPVRVSVVSNGVWSARQRDWILENLDSLSISFDGGETTQNAQRPLASGGGSFKAALVALEALDRAGISYGIRMTATAPWRGRLPEDVRFICEETGCRAMQVEPAFNTERGEHRGPTLEESKAFVEAYMEAFEIAAQAGRKLVYSGARPWLLTQSFCTAPHGALIANPAGDLVTCYEVTDARHPLNEVSTIGRIEAGQVVVDEAARDALLSCLRDRRANCTGCFCYWHCAGDCYTRGLASARDNPEGTSPRCHMNREITARILLWYIMRGDGVWRGQGASRREKQLMREF
jgi:uncharacterized protein